MGWGDEIMVSGQARVMQQADARRVLVLDRHGRERIHAAWDGNPRIAQGRVRGDVQVLVNGPGRRPYIAEKHADRWVWQDWPIQFANDICGPPRGELYFRPEEEGYRTATRGAVVIEPALKDKASPNKDWGRARWARLAELLACEGVDVVQLGPAPSGVLPGARHVRTPDFRAAAGALSGAVFAVLPEGGLHHAAAALGVPAAVIFGGYIAPRNTGYPEQINFTAGAQACGRRTPCAHCAEAMAAIEPADVFQTVMSRISNDEKSRRRVAA